jgi:hypothetical protein
MKKLIFKHCRVQVLSIGINEDYESLPVEKISLIDTQISKEIQLSGTNLTNFKESDLIITVGETEECLKQVHPHVKCDGKDKRIITLEPPQQSPQSQLPHPPNKLSDCWSKLVFYLPLRGSDQFESCALPYEEEPVLTKTDSTGYGTLEVNTTQTKIVNLPFELHNTKVSNEESADESGEKLTIKPTKKQTIKPRKNRTKKD